MCSLLLLLFICIPHSNEHGLIPIAALGSRAAVLKNSSSKYLKDAKQLSWEVMVRKYAPAAVVSFIVLFLFYLRFGLIFI